MNFHLSMLGLVHQIRYAEKDLYLHCFRNIVSLEEKRITDCDYKKRLLI